MRNVTTSQMINGIPLWQSSEWESFQKKLGRKTYTLHHQTAHALLIQHKLPLGKSYISCPRGPLWEKEADLEAILQQMAILANKEGAIYINLDPENALTSDTSTKPSGSHQPLKTLLLDLTLSEADLLAQMKPKGRYNIKVAEKHAVDVRVINKKDSDALSGGISEFNKLLTQTTERNGFSAHDEAYYHTMVSALPSAELLIASQGGNTVSAGIFCFRKEEAIYYYGASSNTHRNTMAAYKLQWESIKEAKKRGCTTYDFLGISSTNAPEDPWAGITEFKRKFGGLERTFPQPMDMVISPIWYIIIRGVKWLQRKIKK